MDGQLVSQTQPDELNHLLDQAPAFKDFGLPESVHDVPSLIEYLEDQHLWTYDRLCALRQCSTATSLALADDSSLLDGLARHDARDWNQLVYLELCVDRFVVSVRTGQQLTGRLLLLQTDTTCK